MRIRKESRKLAADGEKPTNCSGETASAHKPEVANNKTKVALDAKV